MTCRMSRKLARLIYCGFFVASLIISLILREVATHLLENFPWINDNGDQEKEWYQTNTVLRVSLGNFLFFMLLALAMIAVRDESDQRDSWHHKRWGLKVIIWFLLIICMFLMPNEVVSIYGLLAKFGAGLFLSVQFIILLDITCTLKDSCVEKDLLRWYIALSLISLGCWLAAAPIYVILFDWFTPSGHDCLFNAIFISMTIVLGIALAIIVSVRESPFPASVAFLYCAYLCYSALSNEPRGDVCNGLNDKAYVVSLSSLIIGVAGTTVSLFYSALRVDTIHLSPPSSRWSGPIDVTDALLIPDDDTEGDHIESPLFISNWAYLSDVSEDTEPDEVGKNSESQCVSVDTSSMDLAIRNDRYLRPRHIGYLYTRFHPILVFTSRFSVIIMAQWTHLYDSLIVASYDNNDSGGRPAVYSYTFFHLVIALGSMYSAILLSSWISLSNTSDLNSSWSFVWVNIIGWVTAAVYVIAR